MDSPRGRLRSIFILACLLSDVARSLQNEDNPSEFKALKILRRQKDSTKVKETLPVEVNIGGLVNSLNEQIQKLGDHVTRLDNQLQIIKGNEERNRESCKAELEKSKNESQLLERAQNSLKEEIYRLKNESTAIKALQAENERLKMKLEATTHETGIPQGTTSRPKTNGPTWSEILGGCIDSSDQDGWILLQRRDVRATKDANIGNIFARMKWKDYKAGFEDSDIAYWYGLQKMHEKTSSGRWKVAFVFLYASGTTRCSVFNDFKIDGENEKFKLHVGEMVVKFWENDKPGDSFDFYNNMKFSTSDSDNDNRGDVHCAADYGVGWWYKSCLLSDSIADTCINCNYVVGAYTVLAMKRI